MNHSQKGEVSGPLPKQEFNGNVGSEEFEDSDHEDII